MLILPLTALSSTLPDRPLSSSSGFGIRILFELPIVIIEVFIVITLYSHYIYGSSIVACALVQRIVRSRNAAYFCFLLSNRLKYVLTSNVIMILTRSMPGKYPKLLSGSILTLGCLLTHKSLPEKTATNAPQITKILIKDLSISVVQSTG
jgi:hypothetical protein